MTPRRRASPRARTVIQLALVIGAGSILVVVMLASAAALLTFLLS